MNISGRAAVVTGGASGIGQAVARRIFADGGNVIIFDLNAEAGAAMVEEMGADRCLFAEVNVCLLYTSPSPRDRTRSRMPSSA